MNKELLKADIESVLSDKYEVTADKAQPYQLHEALSSAIMKQIAPVWKDSRKFPQECFASSCKSGKRPTFC